MATMHRTAFAAVALIAALAYALTAAAQDAQEQPEPTATTPVATTAAPLSEPDQLQLIDVPNDAGNQLAALFNWKGEPADNTSVALEVKSDTALLKKYELTEAQRNRLRTAREKLAADLAPLLPDRDRLQADLDAADDRLTTEQNAPEDEKNPAELKAAREDYWRVSHELAGYQRKVDAARDVFSRATNYFDWHTLTASNLAEKQQRYEWLAAAIGANEYLRTSAEAGAGDLDTVADHPDIFGSKPADDIAGKLYLSADTIVVPNPNPTTDSHDEYDESPPPSQAIPLEPGRTYVAHLAVTDGTNTQFFDLGPGIPRTNFFKRTVTNNFVIAVLFALVIIVAINIAKKSGHKLFVRRIAGLEAVDEAIGRATEMGRPVLYLNGMTDLTDLSTLAAVNILGRVAGRIAEYDSQLVVPCRDPVVMTVAQEIVRSAYMDAGRPDVYREQDIYFLTQDQFSYTAAVCGIMVRDKPAANFFMGYYYAESLLLAETGQGTGAIQIAGTDSQAQLPFFITTCDYTLIGEELYAASAYLSREPLLLGSLKGQDLMKAVMMLLIVLQTVLFLYKALAHSDAPLDFIRSLVIPL